MTAGWRGPFAALALLACTAASAQPPLGGFGYVYPYGPGATAGRAVRPVAPDDIVSRGVDRLTGFLLGVPSVTPESLGGFLSVEIAPLFDFDYMAEWAGGRYWRRLDESERSRLAATLERLFLGALARNLGTYVEPLPQVDVYPARRTSDTSAQVHARVGGDDGRHVRLEFRFYLDDDAWRIYDVVANGASAVAYYRRYFRDLLRRHGPAALDP